MSFNKKGINHERAKSSFGSLKRVNQFNNKYFLSNNTNLETSHTLLLSESNKLKKDKVYKIKALSKSLFTKKKENLKLKKLLNEKKFHPRKDTESISNTHIKSFKNRFKNFDSEDKVGIFTNKYPSILNNTDKFYSRYFDYFVSPDEILVNNFNKDEIFLIKTEPGYYNFGESFNNVYFFKKKKLKDILNEEEKVGINNIMEVDMQKSLQKSRRKIKSYLNYYTSVMSRRGFIHK